MTHGMDPSGMTGQERIAEVSGLLSLAMLRVWMKRRGCLQSSQTSRLESHSSRVEPQSSRSRPQSSDARPQSSGLDEREISREASTTSLALSRNDGSL